MQKNQQHLEFLLSQHVDDTLDPPNRKLVEQHLAESAEARQLHRQHREMQDLLDDLGSRIPLINWAEFDQKLAARLEAETPVAQRTRAVRRWVRPLAAAAALFVVAAVGYTWHAWTETTPPGGQPAVAYQPLTPTATVRLADLPAPRGSSQTVRYPDAPSGFAGSSVDVALTPNDGTSTAEPAVRTATSASSAMAATTRPMTRPEADTLH